MNIPLINIIGNFITVDNIITFAGTSVGIEASNEPIDEKHKPPRNKDKTNSTGLTNPTPRTKEIISTATIVIENPIMSDANISPIIIAGRFIGVVIILSRVLSLVSQGVITGLIEVEENHNDIPVIPTTMDIPVISLPKENARKKNAGSNNPNITTGPFA